MTDDLQKLREGVAEEYKIALYRQYSEKQAAAIMGTSRWTLRRKRELKQIPYVDKGGDSVAYMGIHIADFILFGVGSVDIEEGTASPHPRPHRRPHSAYSARSAMDEWQRLRGMVATYKGFCLTSVYSTKSTAKYLGCDEYKLRQWTERGLIECVIVDDRVGYDGLLIADILLVKMGYVPESTESLDSAQKMEA